MAALERLCELFPPGWLLPPNAGEIFASKELCNSRLRAFALTKGFDIVRNGGGTAANPAWRFRCYCHGLATRNQRKLEDQVEKNEERKITSKRQRAHTHVHQLDCQWAALCSFKESGKRLS